MSSLMQEEFAMKSEVARYLRIEPSDVDRAVKQDKLPCIRLLGVGRFTQRFPLRGVHAWLLERTDNAPDRMFDYKQFLQDFSRTVMAKNPKHKIQNSK